MGFRSILSVSCSVTTSHCHSQRTLFCYCYKRGVVKESWALKGDGDVGKHPSPVKVNNLKGSIGATNVLVPSVPPTTSVTISTTPQPEYKVEAPAVISLFSHT